MNRLPPRSHVVLLATCVLVLLAQRLHTYDEPFERDITTYAVIGHEVLSGRKLYSDLWDNKSPIVYMTYAAGELAAGYGPLSIFLLGLTTAALTLIGVYAAATVSVSSAAGLWAGVAWTVVSADQALQANQPNIEVFMNASLVWLLVVLMARRTRPVAIGVLSGIASLYKLIVLPTLILTYLVSIVVRWRSPPRKHVAYIAVSSLTFVAVWAVVCGYFAATGRGNDFRQAVFAYNVSFAGDLVANVVAGLAPAQLMPRVLWCAAPLALLASIGVAWLVRARAWHTAGLLLAYAAGTVVSVALPGKFWPHYYQLWLPIFSIGAGIGVHAIGQLIASRRNTPRPTRRRTAERRHAARWAQAIGAIAVLMVVGFELPYYNQSPEVWSIEKYGPLFADVKHLAPDVTALVGADETFFEWGDETGFYYYARRHPPSGIFYIYLAVVESPLRAVLEAKLIADLERTSPELMIVNTQYLYAQLRTRPIVQWLGMHYVGWEKGPARGPFIMYIRQGGALERRLQQQGRL
ncbi:MAG: hypothetical protein HY271_06495 [Deltaproteobacteria bacterium]|nr:hypothetical protein [Deltaproteobacteria bacterium]